MYRGQNLKLVISGGGTGGHVYPAIEVARAAKARGWEVIYLGSLRGQEGSACQLEGIAFEGFPSTPVTSLKRLGGWRSLVSMLRVSRLAGRRLREIQPDFVFATGGYSAAPILQAAHGLGLPVGLHEQNAMPGRTIKLTGKKAVFVATVFRSVEERLPGCRVVRTGMPIRKVLRDAAEASTPEATQHILVVGGSQGASSINEAALGAGVRMTQADLCWTHVCGKANFEAVSHTARNLALPASYKVRPFLDAHEMAAAYASASLVVGRSGAGTLSELAAFRKTSVLIPYPLAFAQHQLHNAREFEGMGAATVLSDDRLDPAALEKEILAWLHDGARTLEARNKLAEWDVPNAATEIIQLIEHQ